MTWPPQVRLSAGKLAEKTPHFRLKKVEVDACYQLSSVSSVFVDIRWAAIHQPGIASRKIRKESAII